jgi:cyclopropane fatty-acyl-phospholipid synthase-like methyltransferase
MAGGYDDGYMKCPCFWGREPGRLVRELVTIVGSFDGLHILDAGCGEGKNTVYLAGLGANVRAIDISFHALSNARQAWSNVGKQCSFELANIQTVELPTSFYDVIIAYGLLHCLPDATTITNTIRRFQNSTKVAGYNIIVTFNGRRRDLRAHPELRPCFLKHEMYMDMYRGWTILHASDEDLEERHPNNNITHVHSMTRLLARKP